MPHREALARRAGLVLSLLLLFGAGQGFAQADPLPPLDLPGAIALARARSPLLRAARLRIDEARGDLTGASLLLLSNPELEVSAGPRLPGLAGQSATAAVDVGIAQRLELGGQRGRRVARATEEVAASRAEADDAERVVSLAVATLFYEGLAAVERSALSREAEQLAGELADVARIRVERGAEPPVVLNSARIRLAEARRKSREASVEQVSTTVRLARTLGLPPGTQVILAGKLPGAATLPPAEELFSRAQDARPDILATSRRLQAARASIGLADATAWPDLTLGVRYGVDQQDRLVTGTLGIALPVFSRNQGEKERSRAAALRVEAELAALRLEVEAQSREARARFEAAVDALAIYDAEVLRAQEDSVALLRTSYAAGKIDFTQVVLLQRELLEGRLGYLDARLAVARAEAGLRAAAGLDLAPAQPTHGEPR